MNGILLKVKDVMQRSLKMWEISFFPKYLNLMGVFILCGFADLNACGHLKVKREVHLPLINL
jgi:hypothetical protein